MLSCKGIDRSASNEGPDAAIPPDATAIPCADSEQPDYKLDLFSEKSILTPLEIPDFDELNNGSTKNTEYVDFRIRNRKGPADSVTLEVLDGETVVYSEKNTEKLLPKGEYRWHWDGYDSAGILDTTLLKSPNLLVRLTATKSGQKQVVELKLENKDKEVDWVDVRIDRNEKTAEVTMRPSFSNGGVDGSTPGLTPVPYPQLLAMAKQGIEYYWSRNGTRMPGIGNDVATAKGNYKVTVKADVNMEPKAGDFKIIEKLDADFGRSTSLKGFRKVYHNHGLYYNMISKSVDSNTNSAALAATYADEDFKHTAAHEVGHFVLNEYGDSGIPEYSWKHKGTSTLTQKPIPNNPFPRSGEIDVMHYFSDPPSPLENRRRSVAAEQDVKGLIWLARVRFKTRTPQYPRNSD